MPLQNSFKAELVDFLRFLRRPTLRRQHATQFSRSPILQDWCTNVQLKGLIKWALFLWLINVFVLAPLAMVAMGKVGGEHRLDINNLPILTIVLWAPLIEELVFRFGLRRPTVVLWFTPLAAWAMVSGPVALSIVIVLLLLITVIAPAFFINKRNAAIGVGSCVGQGRAATSPASLRWLFGLERMPFSAARLYRQHFVWVFYASVFAFAALHLYNFNFASSGSFALITLLLVLPQFFTGLVLAWLRVRRGIASAIALHALFNAGPVLLLWVVVTLMGNVELASSAL